MIEGWWLGEDRSQAYRDNIFPFLIIINKKLFATLYMKNFYRTLLLSFLLIALVSLSIQGEAQVLGKLKIFGWSPKGEYFAFGYNIDNEAGVHLYRYILNSKENSFKKRFEKTLNGGFLDDYLFLKKKLDADFAFLEELKKLKISYFRTEQVYRYGYYVIPEDLGARESYSYDIPRGSSFDPPDITKFQIKGRPYSLKLIKHYSEEDLNNITGKSAKFELLLINEETGQVQVLQRDKSFFRPRTFDYGIYSAFLSPNQDHIAVIIAKFDTAFEGTYEVTFLAVTGKIDV